LRNSFPCGDFRKARTIGKRISQAPPAMMPPYGGNIAVGKAA
jgi:hypothetical protein